MSDGALVLHNRDAVRGISATVKEYQVAIRDCHDDFEKGLLIAEGMNVLRNALTPEVIRPIIALQGTPLGFLTDKDKGGGYSEDVVRDCTIEAWLRGFYHVNNEFNIIAGRFYGAKAGFERKVRQFPGLSRLEIHKANPEMAGGNAFVAAVASWELNGHPAKLELVKRKLTDGQEMDLRISVRVNSGMGVDAILGKADRKLYYAIYNALTNDKDIIPEGDAGEAIDVQVTGAKVKRSNLFDDPATAHANAEQVSSDALQLYQDRLDKAASKPEISQIAKEIGQDRRLIEGHRKMAIGWCNDAMKAIAAK